MGRGSASGRGGGAAPSSCRVTSVWTPTQLHSRQPAPHLNLRRSAAPPRLALSAERALTADGAHGTPAPLFRLRLTLQLVAPPQVATYPPRHQPQCQRLVPDWTITPVPHRLLSLSGGARDQRSPSELAPLPALAHAKRGGSRVVASGRAGAKFH
jgi:hypothetical protein